MTYTTDELVALTGITRSRLHEWRSHGLLPPCLGWGRGVRYTEQHRQTIERILAARAANRRLVDLAADLHARYPHAFGRTSSTSGTPVSPSAP